MRTTTIEKPVDSVIVNTPFSCRSVIHDHGSLGKPEPVRATRSNRDETLKRFTPDEQGRLIRFCEMLTKAKELQRISERELADQLGITLGTSQKYFSYQILPEKINVSTMAKLAALNKVSLDLLLAYIETGDMSTKAGLKDLLKWLSSGEQEEGDLAMVAMAFAESMQELKAKRMTARPLAESPKLQPYSWPTEFLEAEGIKKEWFPNFGFTEEQLDDLIERGEFSDELVEAFAKLIDKYNLSAEDIRWSFETRDPLVIDDPSYRG